MQKILCTLPNAGAEISGIKFEPHSSGGMISVEAQSDEVVQRFLSIPGYKTPRAAKKEKEDDAAKKAAEEAAAKAAAEAAEKQAEEEAKAAEEAAAKLEAETADKEPEVATAPEPKKGGGKNTK